MLATAAAKLILARKANGPRYAKPVDLTPGQPCNLCELVCSDEARQSRSQVPRYAQICGSTAAGHYRRRRANSRSPSRKAVNIAGTSSDIGSARP